MTKLNREFVNFLLLLYREYPWLESRSEGLHELLDLCATSQEQQLLLEVIRLIDFIRPETYQQCLMNMVDEIKRLNLNEADTMLASYSVDEEADSGQLVLYDLRTMLTTSLRWRNTKTVNVIGKVQKHIAKYPNLILVDEFIGTGKSLVGRIKELKRHFENIGVTDYKIFPFALAGMSFGIKHVTEETGHEVFTVKQLKKGISELLNADLRADADALMKQFERLLSPQVDEEPLPNFGYGGAEALYGREGGNCPNSVFPIFWWPLDLSGRQRRTLFVRNFGTK